VIIGHCHNNHLICGLFTFGLIIGDFVVFQRVFINNCFALSEVHTFLPKNRAKLVAFHQLNAIQSVILTALFAQLLLIFFSKLSAYIFQAFVFLFISLIFSNPISLAFSNCHSLSLFCILLLLASASLFLSSNQYLKFLE